VGHNYCSVSAKPAHNPYYYPNNPSTWLYVEPQIPGTSYAMLYFDVKLNGYYFGQLHVQCGPKINSDGTMEVFTTNRVFLQKDDDAKYYAAGELPPGKSSVNIVVQNETYLKEEGAKL
jgi:hypothetical protein